MDSRDNSQEVVSADTRYTYLTDYGNKIWKPCVWEAPIDDVDMLLAGIIHDPTNKMIPNLPQICKMFNYNIDWSKTDVILDKFTKGARMIIVYYAVGIPNVAREALLQKGYRTRQNVYGLIIYDKKYDMIAV